VEDFLSSAALGKQPPRTDPEFLHAWAGLSVFDTYQQARANARRWRWRLGEYIAEIVIPEDAAVTCEGPDKAGHWNLYDLPAERLLGWVSRVVHAVSTPWIDPPRPGRSIVSFARGMWRVSP
jgi:hypothetical protein